jgi:hypothetical protein
MRTKIVLLIIVVCVLVLAYRAPSPSFASSSASTSSFALGVDHADSQGNPFLSTVYNQFNIHWTLTAVSSSSSWKTSVYNVLIGDKYNIVGVIDTATLGFAQTNGKWRSGGSNWGLSDWDYAVTQAEKTYPGIHYWEVWDEPEVPSYEDGYLCCRTNEAQLADHYFNMLRDAYNIIHSLAPGDKVLGPSVTIYTYCCVIDSYSLSLSQEIWALGGGKYTDIASIHMYTLGNMFTTVLSNHQTVGQLLSAGLDKYESVFLKPIWITESGLSTTSNSVQNTFLTQDMSLVLSKSYITGFFWYDVTDWPASTSGYGLWTANANQVFSPRTAAYTFAQYELKV